MVRKDDSEKTVIDYCTFNPTKKIPRREPALRHRESYLRPT